MKVSFHPAQVVTPNKDNEQGYHFQIYLLKVPPKKDLPFTQVLNKDQVRFHLFILFSFPFYLDFIFLILSFIFSQLSKLPIIKITR